MQFWAARSACHSSALLSKIAVAIHSTLGAQSRRARCNDRKTRAVAIGDSTLCFRERSRDLSTGEPGLIAEPLQLTDGLWTLAVASRSVSAIS